MLLYQTSNVNRILTSIGQNHTIFL